MKAIALNKTKFVFISFKKNILPIIFCLFTLFLLIFSSQNLSAAKNGLMLWANSVVPSLFPFFIATELLGYTNIITKFEKILTPIMRPLFNVPGSGAYAFIMGIISGYPIGAKIVTNFRQNGICTKEECERLLAFTNNSGPLFIVGTVGISLYYNSTIGILLLLTHILACISVGIVFRFWKYKKNSSIKHINYVNTSPDYNISFSNLGEILSMAIISSINTILMIGGFVVLFSVIISILENSHLLKFLSYIMQPLLNIFGINNPAFSLGFMSGIIELTNGLKQISSVTYKLISTNIILSSFLLGFGGISVVLQVWAIISKTDISIKPYIIGKVLQGIFAAIYTYIFIKYIPIFNFNL